MMSRLLLCFVVLIDFSTSAQLITSDQSKTKDGMELLPKFNEETYVYLGVDCLNTFRELNPNMDHLNTPLGERANEIPRWMVGYSLRLTVPVVKMIKVNTGLSFQQNGESYDWLSNETDSSFSYQTSFRYIAMPVQLSGEFGKKIGLYGACGITPAIFSSFLQKQQWTNALGSENSQEISIQDDCNSFIISFQTDLGLHYHINEQFGMQLTAQYRKQLNNTYREFENYIHRAHALGFNFSLSYRF